MYPLEHPMSMDLTSNTRLKYSNKNPDWPVKDLYISFHIEEYSNIVTKPLLLDLVNLP